MVWPNRLCHDTRPYTSSSLSSFRYVDVQSRKKPHKSHSNPFRMQHAYVGSHFQTISGQSGDGRVSYMPNCTVEFEF